MKSVPNKLTSEWKEINWVLTDVDDTITCEGMLPPEALIAMDKLQKAGIKVVAVTGACSGWCDQIAQLWPVEAALGENGAITLKKNNGHLCIESAVSLEEMRELQSTLKQQVLEILKDYPDLKLTLDQPYRLCEVAIDIGQNRPKVDSKIINEVVDKIHALGAHATASSIHINAWYGEHSKKVSSLAFLRSYGLSDEEIDEQVCYVGDSANDQAMFATLTKSVGVANIANYWDKLTDYPSVVMTKPGGYGFAEFVDQLLELKSS
ncbi:HAD-IIB family hydrolase [Vibrio sp. HN007]|uniref:HAD-IIB family hydrolase n=1 Tax=Vibrio iocasae TaxID=3098914 RepID=UPI0035D4734B